MDETTVKPDQNIFHHEATKSTKRFSDFERRFVSFVASW